MNQQAIYRSIWGGKVIESDCEVTPSGVIVSIQDVDLPLPRIVEMAVGGTVTVKETGYVFDVLSDSDQNLVITLQEGDHISPDDPLTVAFFNQGNYESFEAAKKEGADYYVPSSLSLYGYSGIMDLKEVIDTLIKCIGCGDDYRCVVQSPSGQYIDIDVVEFYFSKFN